MPRLSRVGRERWACYFGVFVAGVEQNESWYARLSRPHPTLSYSTPLYPLPTIPAASPMSSAIPVCTPSLHAVSLILTCWLADTAGHAGDHEPHRCPPRQGERDSSYGTDSCVPRETTFTISRRKTRHCKTNRVFARDGIDRGHQGQDYWCGSLSG